MPKRPSTIIIARHGARFDQSNKEWHETAERSWDSPLSYGGWIQSQTLGARIATELDTLDLQYGVEAEGEDTFAADLRPRKKRKVIIHSSPYLRCVQTSIGVAAGMRYPSEVSRIRPFPTPFQRSSLSKPPMNQADNKSNGDVSNGTGAQHFDKHETQTTPALPSLRLDPFLGEWLSPGYYEKTTPPPDSSEIIKCAKETLQKPPEEIKGADLARPTIMEYDEMTDEDKENEVRPILSTEKTGLRAMAALGHSLPKRSRTVSFGHDAASSFPSDGRNHRRVRSSTYSPPVPTYSIAPQDSIPPGFVAHARDACLQTDLEWDSQQPPLNWGDGGQYEEEWSTMHRRFRNGLQSMLSYYEFQSILDVADHKNIEDDEDLVLIVVTHQAGCNALIRLVTGAPALHDVGTASLTLAIRKANSVTRHSSLSMSSQSPRRGSLDLGLGEEFEMKVIASTEHLRPGSNPLGLNSPRLGKSPAFASRRLAGADSVEGFSIGDPLSWRSGSHHQLGRSSSLRSHAADNPGGISPLSGSGLWSSQPSRSDSISTLDERIDPMSASATMNGTIHEEDETPSHHSIRTALIAATTPSVKEPEQLKAVEESAIEDETEKINTNGAGLWAPPSAGKNDGLWTPAVAGLGGKSPRNSFGEGSIKRARSPGKRRWTAIDRS